MKKPLIHIVDDESSVQQFMIELLETDYELEISSSLREAKEKMMRITPDIYLLDIKMPDGSGLELLKNIKEVMPEVPVIMVTAVKDIKTAVDAIKSGAGNYITKPFHIEEMRLVIQKELETSNLKREVGYLRETIDDFTYVTDLIGSTKKMQEIFDIIKKIAPQDIFVLITGPSGTGKEIVARTIHKYSKRSHKPFVALNCAAIPDTLIESELFGHERGAFTGAVEKKQGKFEMSNSGTIFLDEIGALKYELQAKILRTLQERQIARLGSTRIINIDIRVISATNLDLEKAIRDGRFRDDLFYRLNVVRIQMPSLKDRIEDIPLFVDCFSRKFAKKTNKDYVPVFSSESIEKLMEHDWPGNIRELENVIERAVILTDKKIIEPDDISITARFKYDNVVGIKFGYDLKTASEQFKKEYIHKTLQRNNFDIDLTASKLCVDRDVIRDVADEKNDGVIKNYDRKVKG